jgi:hypothetical protein
VPTRNKKLNKPRFLVGLMGELESYNPDQNGFLWEDEHFEEVSQCPKIQNEGKNGILSLKHGKILDEG